MENFSLNTITDNIYSKILDKEYLNYKFNQIVLGTKNLVTNNSNFKDFSKEYEDVTKLTTFKIPDEDYFPLLRNKKFVSLGRNQYKYDSKKKKTKKSKILTKLFKSSKSEKFSLSDKNIINNKIKNKSINSFNGLILSPINKKSRSQKKLLYDIIKNKDINNNKSIFKNNNILNRNNLKISSKDNNPSISSNNQEIKAIEDNNRNIVLTHFSNSTNYSSKYKNKNSKSIIIPKNIKSRNIFRIKNNLFPFSIKKKNINNNRILLRDILLEEKSYQKLKYQEEKIFLSNEYYCEYIKNQMILMKKNILNLKYPDKYEKTYENSKFGKLKLILNSITIEFKQKLSFDNKNFNANDEQIFNIPFEYIPIFYYKNLEKLKEILISVFYLDNTYTKFYSKFENLSYILRNSNIFKENKGDNINDKSNVFQQTFTSKIKMSHSQTLINSNFKNLRRNSIIKNNKNKDIYKIINVYTTEYNFSKSQESLNIIFNSKNRVNFKNKYNFYNKNSFEFIWLTSAYQYIVTVRTPEISFKICGIEIKKNIDIELLFFLIENSFKDWHFYIIEYLFSFSDFCLIINNFFSIYKTNNIHNLKLIHDYKHNNNVIYLTKEKKLHYSKKNSKLEYIFTDNNLNNFIKILHNYKLFVFNKKVNPFYQFCFHLNFNQMKSLYLASKKQGIKYLFEKMIIYDKENMKIKLKYDYLDNFCKKDLNNLELLLPNSISIKANKYNFVINDNKFCLFYPILESIKINKNLHNNDCFESNLEEEVKNGMNMNILDSLFKYKDIYQWPSILEFINNEEKLKRHKRRVSIKYKEFNFELLVRKKTLNFPSKKVNI